MVSSETKCALHPKRLLESWGGSTRFRVTAQPLSPNSVCKIYGVNLGGGKVFLGQDLALTAELNLCASYLMDKEMPLLPILLHA